MFRLLVGFTGAQRRDTTHLLMRGGCVIRRKKSPLHFMMPPLHDALATACANYGGAIFE